MVTSEMMTLEDGSKISEALPIEREYICLRCFWVQYLEYKIAFETPYDDLENYPEHPYNKNRNLNYFTCASCKNKCVKAIYV